MNNIDKDIDRLKELQSTIYEGGDHIYLNKNDKQALGNVLTEFQGLRDFSTETVRRSAELQVELEIYKKIDEKLADKLVEIEDGCKYIPTEICNKYSNGRCKQCIIDWARKEVEKNEKSNI